MPSGRKSLKDEIQILNRYAELAPKYFRFINEMLDESAAKEDRKWAAERLDKAFPKFIPQQIEGTANDGAVVIKLMSFGNSDSLQLDTGEASTTNPTESGEIQSGSDAPQSSQDDVSNQ